jgi:hypothetical protein
LSISLYPHLRFILLHDEIKKQKFHTSVARVSTPILSFIKGKIQFDMAEALKMKNFAAPALLHCFLQQ